MDEIPNELIRHIGVKGREMIRQMLSVVLRERKVPKQWKEDRISLIYKGKGNRSELDNYRGISVGSNMGKVFMRVMQNRLERVVEEEGILGEIQNAFRGDRRGIDSIFSLSQIMEICRIEKRDLYMAFVDLRKAFDRVSRASLWECLGRIGFQ